MHLGIRICFLKNLLQTLVLIKNIKIQIFCLSPNRTHKSFYDKLNYKVFYLSDIKTSSKDEFKYCVNKEIATQKNQL